MEQFFYKCHNASLQMSQMSLRLYTCIVMCSNIVRLHMSGTNNKNDNEDDNNNDDMIMMMTGTMMTIAKWQMWRPTKTV